MAGHLGHEHVRLHTDRRALAVALALIAGLTAAEVATGIVAHSLALLADGGHLVSDAAALGFALFASTMATRPARNPSALVFHPVPRAVTMPAPVTTTRGGGSGRCFGGKSTAQREYVGKP